MAGARALQRRVFMSGLPSLDRGVFASGRRLDPAARRALGPPWAVEAVPEAALSPQVAAKRGVPLAPEAASRCALDALVMDAWLVADPFLLDLCLDGLSNGAILCYEGPRQGSLSLPSYGSALEHAAFFSSEREAEQGIGWLSAWDGHQGRRFPAPDFGPVCGGALATNEGPPKLSSRFPDFALIAQLLLGASRSASCRRDEGVAAWLIELDVASAFRLVPVRLADLLAVIEWMGRFACPLRLTFGGRASIGIWERFGFLFETLLSLWAPRGTEVVRWVDGFLLVCVCSEERARAMVSLARFLGDRYGFPLKVEKLQGPCHRLEFIGWEFDVSPSLPEPTVSVPAGKREKFARSASFTLACPSRVNFDKFLGKASNFSSVFSGLRAASLPSPVARRGALRHPVSRESADVWVLTLGPCLGWGSSHCGRLGSGGRTSTGAGAPTPLRSWPALSCVSATRQPSGKRSSLPLSSGQWGASVSAAFSLFFELDSQSAALALEPGAASAPELDEAVRRVRSALVISHCAFSFSHIPRELNALADSLSKDLPSLFLSQTLSEGLLPSRSPLLSPASGRRSW
eukprot:g32095.t1